MLVLLSDKLRSFLLRLKVSHPTPIIEDLLIADDLIINVNELSVEEEENEICIPMKVAISNLINDSCRQLSYRAQDGYISFLPKGKTPIYTGNGNWDRTNRQTGKPARIIQNLLVKKYSCTEYEQFQNAFRGLLTETEFKIVEGADITKYYNENTYYDCSGSLGNSCMRYSKCAPYFKIYEDNAKMLVAFKEGKVAGRALIWEIGGHTILDRIYVYVDFLYDSFIGYAEERGWWHRDSNALLYDDEDQYFLTPDDGYNTPIVPGLILPLKFYYPYLPYMDSFRYYNEDDNCLCTTRKEDFSTYLSFTNGVGEDLSVCDRCGEVVESNDDLHYSEYDDQYLCDCCCWYSDDLKDYISIDHDRISIHRGPHDFVRDTVAEYYAGDSDYEIIDGDLYYLPAYTKQEICELKGIPYEEEEEECDDKD